MQIARPGTPGYKWWAFSALAIGTFISVADHAGTIVALPTIADDLDTDLLTAQWVLVGYSVTIAALLLPMGKLGDIVGRKPVYVAGLIAFIVGSALAGSAPNVIGLILAKVLTGCGAAMTQGTGTAMLVSIFPREERGKALGSYISVVGAADLGGAPLAGLIVGSLGWQWMFYSTIPVAALAALAVVMILGQHRGDRDSRQEKFDWPGAALSAGMLSTFLIALTSGSSVGWTSPAMVALGAMFVVLVAAFVAWERRTTSPILDLAILKKTVVSMGISSMFLCFVGSSSVRFLMPFYLQKVLGFSPTYVGLILMPSALTFILAGPISGQLSDRYGWRKFTVAGLLMTASGLLILSRVTETSPLVMALVGTMLQTSGMSTFNTPNNSAILGAVEQRAHGMAAGLLHLVRNSGNVSGIAVATAIVTATMASMGHPPSLEAVTDGGGSRVLHAFTEGLQTAYLALGCVVLVAMALSFLGGGLPGRSLPRPAAEPET